MDMATVAGGRKTLSLLLLGGWGWEEGTGKFRNLEVADIIPPP